MISLCFLSLCRVVCMSSSFVRYKNAYTHKIAFSLPCFRYFFLSVCFCCCLIPLRLLLLLFFCCCLTKQQKNAYFHESLLLCAAESEFVVRDTSQGSEPRKVLPFVIQAIMFLCECKCVHMIPLRNALQIDFYVNVIKKCNTTTKSPGIVFVY